MQKMIVTAVLIGSLVVTGEAQARRGGGLLGALLGAGAIAVLGSLGSEARPGERDYKGNILRPAQLKECLLTAHRLDGVNDELDAAERPLNTEQAALDQIQEQIDRAKQYPLTSQWQVDQLNEQIDRFNNRLHAQQAANNSYNQRVAIQNGKVEQFNQTCADHRFFDYDLNAMKDDLPFNVDAYIKKS